MTAGRFCAILMLALFSGFARAQSTRPAEQENAGGNATAEPAATSQPAPPPFFRLDYSGDLLHRPALTGDWGGARSKLAEKGISFNVETLNYMQGNAHGGKSTNGAFHYGGSADYTLQLDTGRMGLWPGGYFKVRGETRWGEGVTGQVGAMAPPNFDAILPALEPNGVTTLTEYYMIQFLSEKLGVIAGQVDPSRLPGGNVFTSDPYGQFMNTALWQPVAAFAVVPPAAMTAGAIYMPTKWLTGVTVVMDSYGLPSVSGFDSAFHSPQGTSILQCLTFNIKPFNLDGHQRFNFGYSTREHYQWEDAGRLFVSGVPVRPDFRVGFPESPEVFGRRWRLPSALQAAAKRVIAPDPTNSQNWAFWYDFDQYLYQSPEDPTQGFGLFGGFGLTPGNWFPVSQTYTLGLGGKGLIHGRPGDRYGVGYYCLNLSDDLPALFDVNNAEQGVEVFYNIEITPWCHITPDLQVIAHPGGGDHDVALVYGLRMQVSF